MKYIPIFPPFCMVIKTQKPLSQKKRKSQKQTLFLEFFTSKFWKDIHEKHFKDAFVDAQRYFKRRPVFGYLALMTIMMVGVSLLQIGGQWFKASIVDAPLPFDGATMPYQQTADWYNVGGKNTKKYSEYSSAELISAPEYNISTLQSESTDQKTVNAKITYSIVYSGKYEFDHQEYAGSHPGVDIKLPEGTPIFSIANGVVVKAVTQSNGFGYHIVVKHDKVPEYGTVFSSYSHLSAVDVQVGQIVKRGEKIGNSGNTGSSTTPHLHFQIDQASAPFHPYWPFSSADAANAGISFSEGVNVGLGKENIKLHTLHPFNFIKSNKNNEAVHSSAPSATASPTEKIISGKDLLKSFEMSVSADTVKPKESVKVTIIAKDASGNTIQNFSESISINMSDKNTTIPNLVQMYNGTYSFETTFETIGRIYIDVKYGKITKRVSVKVTKEEETVNNPTPDPTETTAPQTFSHFTLSAPEKGNVGEPLTIAISALDTNGDFMKTVENNGGYVFSSQGGSVTPKTLSGNDFIEGKAMVTFLPESVGKAVITLQQENISIAIEGALSNAQKIFADVREGDPHAEAIAFLKDEGITTGYNDGTFQPNRTVSRVESLVLLLRAMGIPMETSSPNPFPDIDETWKISPIVTASRLKIATGYSDGTFQPDKIVNRVEYFKILLKMADMPIPENVDISPFEDTPAEEWYAPYASVAKQESLLDFKNSFEPAKGITRGEVAETLYRVLR